MIPPETLNTINKTLHMIVDKVYKETGCPIYLGWGIVTGEDIQTGSMSSDDLTWGDACRLMVGLTERLCKEYPTDRPSQE